MRGERLARQWRILRAMEASPRGLTVAELARREGVGLRTAYRDLQALQEAGFPLYNERVERASRWMFVDTFRFKVPPPFEVTELMALHLYGDLVRVFRGTPFYDALESLFKKVQSTLPPQALSYLERINQVFHVGIKPYSDYGRIREILNQVSRAAVERRRVEMMYHSLSREEPVLRKVDPYKVWFFEGTMYLIAHCHLRGEVRMFVLDRIKMLNVTKETFDLPADFDLGAFMGDSFKVMHDTLHEVKVWVSPEWARWVGEKVWHESQSAHREPDGSLLLTFRVAGLDEVKRWILSFGPAMEALEPEELRREVLEELTRASALYEPARARAQLLDTGEDVQR